MALKSRRPPAGASWGGKKATLSSLGKRHDAGAGATKKSSKQPRAVAVETIEARLERKATVADTQTFGTESLGK